MTSRYTGFLFSGRLATRPDRRSGSGSAVAFRGTRVFRFLAYRIKSRVWIEHTQRMAEKKASSDTRNSPAIMAVGQESGTHRRGFDGGGGGLTDGGGEVVQLQLLQLPLVRLYLPPPLLLVRHRLRHLLHFDFFERFRGAEQSRRRGGSREKKEEEEWPNRVPARSVGG